MILKGAFFLSFFLSLTSNAENFCDTVKINHHYLLKFTILNAEDTIDDCQIFSVADYQSSDDQKCTIKKLTVFCIDSLNNPYEKKDYKTPLNVERYVYCDASGNTAWSDEVETLSPMLNNCKNVNQNGSKDYFPIKNVLESQYQCNFVGNPLYVKSLKKCKDDSDKYTYTPKFCRAAISCEGEGQILLDSPTIDDKGMPNLNLINASEYNYAEITCLEDDCIDPILCLRRPAKDIQNYYQTNYTSKPVNGKIMDTKQIKINGSRK